MLDSVQTWLTPCSPWTLVCRPSTLLPQAPGSWQQDGRAAQRRVSTQRVGEQHGMAAVTERVTTPPRPCMLGVVRHYVSQRGARIVGTEMSRRAMGTDTALNSPANADCPLVPRFDPTLCNELSNYRLAARRSGSVNLAWPRAGGGSWTGVVLAREMFGALVHDGGLVWFSGVPGSLVGVLVVDR